LTRKVAEYLDQKPSLPARVRDDLAWAACIGLESISPISQSGPSGADEAKIHDAMVSFLERDLERNLKSTGLTPQTIKKPEEMPIFTDREIQYLVAQAKDIAEKATPKMDITKARAYISQVTATRRALFTSQHIAFFEQANKDCQAKMLAAGLSPSIQKNLLKRFQEQLIEKYIPTPPAAAAAATTSAAVAPTAAASAATTTANPAIPGTSKEVDAEIKALYETSLYEISHSRSRITVGSGQPNATVDPEEDKLRQALISNHLEKATYVSSSSPADRIQFQSQGKSGVALGAVQPTIVAEYHKDSKTVSFGSNFSDQANQSGTIEAINTALVLEGIGSGTLTKKSDGTLNGTIAIKFLSDDPAIINLATQALVKLMKENPDLKIAHLPETQAGAKLRENLQKAIEAEITAAAGPTAGAAAATAAVPAAATQSAFSGQSLIDIMQRVAPVATAVAAVAATPAAQAAISSTGQTAASSTTRAAAPASSQSTSTGNQRASAVAPVAARLTTMPFRAHSGQRGRRSGFTPRPSQTV
jgi:hypothetical protein